MLQIIKEEIMIYIINLSIYRFFQKKNNLNIIIYINVFGVIMAMHGILKTYESIKEQAKNQGKTSISIEEFQLFLTVATDIQRSETKRQWFDTFITLGYFKREENGKIKFLR